MALRFLISFFLACSLVFISYSEQGGCSLQSLVEMISIQSKLYPTKVAKLAFRFLWTTLSNPVFYFPSSFGFSFLFLLPIHPHSIFLISSRHSLKTGTFTTSKLFEDPTRDYRERATKKFGIITQRPFSQRLIFYSFVNYFLYHSLINYCRLLSVGLYYI